MKYGVNKGLKRRRKLKVAGATDRAQFLHKLLRLRVAAFACHQQTRDAVESVMHELEPFRHARLHFHAFLCDVPATRHGRKASKLPSLVAPFIDAEIVGRTLCLNLPFNSATSKRQMDALCRQFIEETQKAVKASLKSQPFRMNLSYTNRQQVSHLWERYVELGSLGAGSSASPLHQQWLDPSQSPSEETIPHVFTRKACLVDMSNKLGTSSRLTLHQKVAYINLFALLYYALLTSENANDCFVVIPVPLQTARTFYGVIMALLEVPNGLQTILKPRIHGKGKLEFLPEAKEHIDLISKRVWQQAKDVYLPTLILSQNSFEEFLVEELLENKTSVGRKSKDKKLRTLVSNGGFVYARNNWPVHLHAPNELLYASNDDLEGALIDVWRRRHTTSNREVIKESLVFGRMMAASPGLISAIKKAASLGLRSCRGKPPLPSVLVVAPPGSGKENMADLIRVFSDHFWNKPAVKLNMGSVLQDLRYVEGGLQGWLRKLGTTGRLKRGGTLVLDELNSLDITAQPFLLRLLEQGELFDPLAMANGKGGHPRTGSKVPGSAKKYDWLIVGLVNELPSRLTLENLREQVVDNPLLGELLGATLYEHWKNKSRLRDDLYYRVCRSGQVTIQGLNERRQDIPVIFYFILRKVLKEALSAIGGSHEVFLDYDAMKLLTDRTLDWKGNVRRLEAVARQVPGALASEHMHHLICVHKAQVEQAISRVFEPRYESS